MAKNVKIAKTIVFLLFDFLTFLVFLVFLFFLLFSTKNVHGQEDTKRHV